MGRFGSNFLEIGQYYVRNP